MKVELTFDLMELMDALHKFSDKLCDLKNKEIYCSIDLGTSELFMIKNKNGMIENTKCKGKLKWFFDLTNLEDRHLQKMHEMFYSDTPISNEDDEK